MESPELGFQDERIAVDVAVTALKAGIVRHFSTVQLQSLERYL